MILNVHVQYLQHTTEYTKPLYWKRLTIKKKAAQKVLFVNHIYSVCNWNTTHK